MENPTDVTREPRLHCDRVVLRPLEDSDSSILYENVKEYAKNRCSANVVICGSGPSIVTFFDSEKEDATAILNALKDGFKNVGIQSDGFITSSNQGIKDIT